MKALKSSRRKLLRPHDGSSLADDELQDRLREAEETLEAIRSGAVDAVVVDGADDLQIYTLTGADQSYRIILQTMSEGACTISSEGMVLYCNQRLADLVQLPLERIIGSEIIRYVHLHFRGEFEMFLRRAANGTTRQEFIFARKDNSRLPVMLSASPLSLNGLNAVCIVVTDLTELKKSEDALRRMNDHLEQRVMERTSELKEANSRLEDEVAERRQIEEELRCNEAELRAREADLVRNQMLLQAVLNGTSDPVYVKDQKSRILLANPALARVVGLPLEKIIGRTDGEYYDDAAIGHSLRAHDVHVMESGAGEVFEETVPTTGGYRTFLSSKAPYRNEHGNVIGTIGISRDITERKQMEEALRQSETRFRNLAEAAWEGLLIHDDGIIVDLNTPLADMLGYTGQEILGRPILDFVDPAYHELVKRQLRTPYEIEVLHKDGHKVPVEVLVKPYTRKHQVIVAVRDLTLRKQAKEALRQSEERFRVTLDNSPVAVVNMDRNLRYTWAYNLSAGFDPVTVIGKTDRQLFGEELGGRLMAVKQRVLDTGLEAREEIRYTMADGKDLWRDLIVQPHRDDKGNIIGLIAVATDITWRKKSEEELRRRTEELQALMDAAPVGVFLSPDASSSVIIGNPAAYTLLNMPQGANVSKTAFQPETHWQEYQGGKPLAAENLPMQRACRGEYIRNFEMDFVFDDGTKKTLLCNASPMFNRDGSVRGGVAVLVDITVQKQAEIALRESEERFRQLAEGSYEGVVIHSDGLMLDLNTRMAQMMGYEVAELIGKPIEDYIDATYLPTVHEHIDHQSQEMYQAEVIHRDGHRVPVEVMARHIVWRGKVARITALRDMTERKKAEEVLRFQAHVLSNIHDAVFTMDEDFRITSWNKAAEALYGWTAAEVLGKDSPSVLQTNVKPHERQDVMSAVRKDGHWTGIVQHHTKSCDPVWIDASVISLKDEVGHVTGLAAANRDITARVKAEEQIRKHTEDLEKLVAERTAQIRRLERQRHEAEKQASIGRMAARVAHEINNPLAGIKNSFLLVKRAIPRDYKHYEFVGRIEKELDRIARIVRQMFEIYKPERNAISPVDVTTVLKDVAMLLEGNARAQGVTLKTEQAIGCGLVKTHEDSVRQVLFSIIQNAIEASPKGSSVEIHAECTDKVLAMKVTDHGCGIPPEIGARIFEPFFTTKSELVAGGLGLGLSITKGVVEAMGGVLSFESEPGKGTTFQVIIPLNPTTEEQ